MSIRSLLLRSIFVSALLFPLGILPAGSAPVSSDHIVDEVVAVVGSQTILLSDVEREMEGVRQARLQQGGSLTGQSIREEAFESLLLRKLLSEQARADSLQKDLGQISDLQVELSVQEEIDQLGSVKALEKKYGKEIFAIKEDRKREAEEIQLAQALQRKVLSRTVVNYPEVRAFFDSLPHDSMELVPEQYVYAQIVRKPPQTEERKFQVRQQLLQYRQRILDGERIAAMARIYSQDYESARKGGEWGPDEINKLVPQMVDLLEGLKPGVVSEIVETEYGFHIAELISLRGDIVHYRHILLKPEFTVEELEQEIKLLDSLAKTIGDDKQKFEEAVVRYSNDMETNQNGGVVFNSAAGSMSGNLAYAGARFMKEQLKPVDYIPLSKLRVGELSPAYFSFDDKNLSQICKIVRLNEVIPAHAASLEQDYELIEGFALRNKQGLEFMAWIKQTIGQMYVWISPEYRGLRFEHNWVK